MFIVPLFVKGTRTLVVPAAPLLVKVPVTVFKKVPESLPDHPRLAFESMLKTD